MNINDGVINTIISCLKNHQTTSIRVLDWHFNDTIETNTNNYTTRIFRLMVRYQLCGETNSSPEQKIFFVKVPSGAPLYEMAALSGGYDNEVLMYTQVFPKMYAIEKQYFTPKLYYFDSEMSLVLKDLTQSGYKCADRVQKLDVEHCIYALRCLAKFHALSVKLERSIGLPESVKSYSLCTSKAAKKFNTFMEAQLSQFIDSVPENLKKRYSNLITYLETLSVETLINNLSNLSSSEFNVLNHGDISINNIMFQYDKYGLVRKTKFIDFQFTFWSSPAVDLMYFFITCVSFEDYQKYFSLFVNVYMITLNKILRVLDCPTYNTQSLLNEIDILYPYALFILSCLLPIIVRDPKDVEDPKNMELEEGKIESTNPYKQEHYREISAKWFEHLARKGTLRIDEEHPSSNGEI